MPYHTTIRGERFVFADLREVFARANEEKSGDRLAGIAARTERERVAAKMVLADITLGDIVNNPLIDPAHDEVSRLILDGLDRGAFQSLQRSDGRPVPRIPPRRYDRCRGTHPPAHGDHRRKSRPPSPS